MNIDFSTCEVDSIVTVISSNQGPVNFTLPARSTTLAVNIALLAASNNFISIISSCMPYSVNITVPKSIFYPSWSFTPWDPVIALTDCSEGTCFPVSRKITQLGGQGPRNASVYIPTPHAPDLAGPSTKKFINIYYCNNDIAYTAPFYGTTNTRNITLYLNSNRVQVELPLTGKSSELYSPGLGWYNTGIFGVLLDGWHENGDMVSDLNFFAVGGSWEPGGWSQPWAAEVVGIEVFM